MVKKQKNQSLVPVVLALVVILLLLGGAVYVHMKGSNSKQGACSVSASAASMGETCSDAEQTCKTYTKDKACNNDSCCAWTTS